MYFIPSLKHADVSSESCDITRGTAPQDPPAELQGILASGILPVSSQGVPLLFSREEIPVPEDMKHREASALQAYRLKVSSASIEISAPAAAGLRFGLFTLKQLIQQSGNVIPCMSAEDYPLVPLRGAMIDVSRGKIPNWETLEEMVRFLAQYKYNVLQLYFEDTYRIPGHPLVGLLSGGFTREEIIKLDAYCAQWGIELQPNIQCFSHMHGILRLPGYEHLSENENLFTLAACREEVYDLLRDILGEVLSWFTSRTVHLNMDEPYDLGTGFSKSRVQQEGSGRVFGEYLREVCSIARSSGTETILLWGDAVQKYPELLQELEDDVVCVDWNYNPLETYPSLDLYGKAKRSFWAAPGTSSWNALFPRVQNAYQNIRVFTREAYEKGAEGILMTHWGDYGHHQPFSFSYYGLLYGAQQSFSGTAEVKAFEDAAEQLFFDSPKQKQGFFQLAEINTLEGLQVGFKTQTIYALFDDLLKGLTLTGNDIYPVVPLQTFTEMHRLADMASENLMVTEEDSRFSRELLLSAELLRFTGKKGMLSYEIRGAFASSKVDPQMIMHWMVSLRMLFQEFSHLRHRFASLWQEEAKLSGRECALYLFDKAASRYDEAVRWLEGQRRELLNGNPVDSQMSTYTAHRQYTTLWTGCCLNMWDKAYPWR